MFHSFAKNTFRKQCVPRLAALSRSTTNSVSGRGMSSSIQRLGTSDPRMSKVVIHNQVVYTSGLVDLGRGSIEEQTKTVLQEVDELLEEAGTNKSKLLTASIWLKDIETDFAAMNEIWVDWMDPDNKPVRATVESPMARPDILVEIQVTAAVDSEE